MNAKKITQVILSGADAILHGEFLLKLHIDKYFAHILVTFLTLWGVILMDMVVERTMVKVEDNKAILSDLKIYHAHKTVQLVSLNRISTVDRLLQKEGSEVTLPSKPAVRIKK